MTKICEGLEKRDYVLGLIFSKDKQQVALIRKDRPTWQAGMLNGIGGKVELNESPVEAMVRECEEETTVVIPEEEWNYFSLFKGDWGSVYTFSAVIDDITTLKCPESEVIEYHDVNQLHLEYLAPNILFLVPMALTESVKLAKIKTE